MRSTEDQVEQLQSVLRHLQNELTEKNEVAQKRDVDLTNAREENRAAFNEVHSTHTREQNGMESVRNIFRARESVIYKPVYGLVELGTCHRCCGRPRPPDAPDSPSRAQGPHPHTLLLHIYGH